jgi:hypothetical protein
MEMSPANNKNVLDHLVLLLREHNQNKISPLLPILAGKLLLLLLIHYEKMHDPFLFLKNKSTTKQISNIILDILFPQQL